MSMTARPATAAPVRASISTPVRSAVRTVTRISTRHASASTRMSTSTPWIASGWHNGMRSGVRFVAEIAAMRATARASPLGIPPPRSIETTCSEIETRQRAVAERTVTCFSVTSTMRASPRALRWVNAPGAVVMPAPYDLPAAFAGRRPPTRIASRTSSRACTEWPGTNVSTYGSAAAMPPTSGS